MAEKEHKEQKIGSQLPGESIKVIAESVGISGIPDDAASVLAEDSSYRLKQIVQVSSLLNMYYKYRYTIIDFWFNVWVNAIQINNSCPYCMSSRKDHDQK